MDLKINTFNEYDQLDIYSIPTPKEQEQYKEFTIDDFFKCHNLPCKFEYGLQFRKAFHELSIKNVIKPQSLAIELKAQASGEKSSLKICGELKCIKSHFIYHEHVDSSEIESLVINLNRYMKKEKIRLNKNSIKNPEDTSAIVNNLIRQYNVSRTGHWLITTNIQGKKIYLDICKHDDDHHVKTHLHQYISEFQNIPQKYKHNK